MRIISRSDGIRRLRALKAKFAESIRTGYEHRAKSCDNCETKGACCLDAHFVNVHVTRLEATAIGETIKKLPVEKREAVARRIAESITRHRLTEPGDTFSKTFACPLFEPQAGCLVHADGAKPLPCIHHACYENQNDLPPDELLDEAAAEVERLNLKVYGERAAAWLPLPLAVKLSIDEDAG
jgi:hypothetical protein